MIIDFTILRGKIFHPKIEKKDGNTEYISSNDFNAYMDNGYVIKDSYWITENVWKRFTVEIK